MNKRHILPLIFIFAATGLFAQESAPSFSVGSIRGNYELSGDVNSGLWAHFNNKEDGDPFFYVQGLREAFLRSYEKAVLPSETGFMVRNE